MGTNGRNVHEPKKMAQQQHEVCHSLETILHLSDANDDEGRPGCGEHLAALAPMDDRATVSLACAYRRAFTV